MVEENLNFRLRKIDEVNYFLEEIKHSYLVSKNHKKVYKVLNYIEQSFILVSAITSFVSISVFASLVFLLVLKVLQ